MNKLKKFSLSLAVIFFCIAALGNKTAYASDLNNGNFFITKISDSMADELLSIYSDSNQLTSSVNYCISNPSPLITRSSYTVKDFSYSYVFGLSEEMITIIRWTGQGYFYDNGLVHLYTIGVSIDYLAAGWQYEVLDYVIQNTDGSLSRGYAYIDFRSNLQYAIVGCAVEMRKDSSDFYDYHSIIEQGAVN